MSSTLHRTPKPGGQSQSLFFRDLATPVSTHRGKFTSPGQAAAVSALWRENFGGNDPPPPPVFTLEDRAEFSPESGLGDYSVPQELKAETGATPSPASVSPLKSKSEAGTSLSASGGGQSPQSPASLSWWTPVKSGSPSMRSGGDQSGKGSASPVGSAVQPGVLLTLPPPREVARPDIQRNALPAGDLDEETWVTVYGFSPGNTNLVLREFEKCGTILRHIVGPRDSNWMHILYQNRFDAQIALSKNGTQLNGVLIVGVKPLDPSQRQYLDEKITNSTRQGIVFLPLKPTGGASGPSPLRASPRPYYLQNTGDNCPSVGAIAAPAKSAVSKLMDLMFGV